MKAEGHGRILETVKRYQAAIEYLRSHTATGGGHGSRRASGHRDLFMAKDPGISLPVCVWRVASILYREVLFFFGVAVCLSHGRVTRVGSYIHYVCD